MKVPEHVGSLLPQSQARSEIRNVNRDVQQLAAKIRGANKRLTTSVQRHRRWVEPLQSRLRTLYAPS